MMRTVALIVFPGFQALDLAVNAVFELANDELGQTVYSIETLSESGGLVASSFGASVDSRPFDAPSFDTVIMTGGLDDRASTPGLIAFLKAASAASRRTASICTGAFFLAEAGMLDGRRATTHWRHARELKRRHPKVTVEEDRIFIEDRGVWTSAGMTACIDLALALVEDDVGGVVARAIAKRLVVYHMRTGGQSQFSAMLDLKPASDRIQTALAFARENIAIDLSVERLAAVARLSPRQFSRAFRSETGQSPAKAVETLRVEAARQMLEAGRLSNEAIAREAGFADPDRMRRAFVRAFGQPPQAIRRAAKKRQGAFSSQFVGSETEICHDLVQEAAADIYRAY